jgi:hypothetical protein
VTEAYAARRTPAHDRTQRSRPERRRDPLLDLDPLADPASTHRPLLRKRLLSHSSPVRSFPLKLRKRPDHTDSTLWAIVTREEKGALDDWYIRRASLWLDARIALLTLRVLFTGERRSEQALFAPEVNAMSPLFSWAPKPEHAPSTHRGSKSGERCSNNTSTALLFELSSYVSNLDGKHDDLSVKVGAIPFDSEFQAMWLIPKFIRMYRVWRGLDLTRRRAFHLAIRAAWKLPR